MYKLLPFLFFLSLSTFAQHIPDSVYLSGIPVRTVENPVLEEMSGLAFSKKHPDKFYTHTDSGGEIAVFVLDALGNEIGKINLEGVENRDWEDIAVAPGPGDKSFVYVAEIGDNLGVHQSVQIFRFQEPDRFKSEVGVKPEILTFTYPAGAMDAESLFVDPISGDIFVVSKRDSQNTLFRLKSGDFGKSGVVAEEMGKLPFTSSTAADISQDGSKILIKNYFKVFFWERKKGESVAEALSRTPKELPYVPEPQGEAIGFQPDGKAYYTISEKRFNILPVLYRFPAKN
ncbi:hypothetical protein D0X99_05685 [Algoriphagus lacus]|uniref:PE-PGRS family protein n=1 Tax=Algoriphagus lacus TaxID=2056311 RepID=A0A418PUN4_9BACT|nr:hypothetical protein [Algoriphagus lacus]RIW17239.1 hypothetical protein D0X99_05685 [Algoriphagus lacus]